jgi:hypothetical protein
MQTPDEPAQHPYSDFQTKKLKTLLEHYGKASCVDMHDRVYAFIGLVEVNHGIKVDYGRSIIALFLDVMDHFLKSGEPLDSYKVAVEALELTKESLVEHLAAPRERDQQPRFLLKAWYVGCIESIIDNAGQTDSFILGVDECCWAKVPFDFGWVECLTSASVQVGDQIWRVGDSQHGYVIRCRLTGSEDIQKHSSEVISRFRLGTFVKGKLAEELNDGSYNPSVSHLPEFSFEKADEEPRRCSLNGTGSSCFVCMEPTVEDIVDLKLTNEQLTQAVLDEMTYKYSQKIGTRTS